MNVLIKYTFNNKLNLYKESFHKAQKDLFCYEEHFIYLLRSVFFNFYVACLLCFYLRRYAVVFFVAFLFQVELALEFNDVLVVPKKRICKRKSFKYLHKMQIFYKSSMSTVKAL